MFVNCSTDNMLIILNKLFNFTTFLHCLICTTTTQTIFKIPGTVPCKLKNKKCEVIYMQIQVREDVALIDQIVLNNIEIVHIADITQLIKRNIIEISTNTMQYTMADGQEFTRLIIKKDGVIDYMTAGAMYKPYQKINYCNITLSVKDSSSGNLCCYTIDEYRQKLKEIQTHLQNTYGIETNIAKVTIKEIEVNKTFALAHPYEDYHRVIKLIMHNLPAELHIQMYCMDNSKEKIKPGTCYARSSKTEKSDRHTTLKIYDKSSSLSAKLNIILDTSYMRVEIRLIGTKRVKNALTTNKLSAITDDMINTCYQRLIKRYIYNPHNKWLQERNKNLLNIMKQQRDKDIRHWQVNLLRYLTNKEIEDTYPTLLDVCELFPLLERLPITPKRRYEIRTNFKRHAAKYETVFHNRDDLKLAEILEKLGKPTS